MGMKDAVPAHADLVIVGAGMAGLTLAAELEAASGAVPLVLEAGPDSGLDHYRYALDQRRAQAYWLTPEVDPDFWRPYQSAGDSFGGIAGLRRRLGGRSLYWHGVTLPIEPWALLSAEWPTAVRHSLLDRWHGGPSLYEQVTGELERWSQRSSLSGPHCAQLAGYSLRETPTAVRVEANGRRRIYSPVEYWRATERSLPVITGCYTLGLLIRHSRIVGVRVHHNGATSDIRAAKVVLAAGTVENSRLVIQALNESGRLDQPELTGLADKISYGFAVVLRPDAVPSWLADAAAQGRVFVAAAESLRSNLFVRGFLSDTGEPGVDVWLMGEQLPEKEGFIRCRDSGGWPWTTHVGRTLSQTDIQLAAAQRIELERVHTALSEIVGGQLKPLEFDAEFGSRDLTRRMMATPAMDSSGVPVTYSFPIGSEQHESGTLRMGELVDADQRVIGIDGLFATGPCVFPRPGAANPALTTLALAKHLAGTLAS